MEPNLNIESYNSLFLCDGKKEKWGGAFEGRKEGKYEAFVGRLFVGLWRDSEGLWRESEGFWRESGRAFVAIVTVMSLPPTHPCAPRNRLSFVPQTNIFSFIQM